MNPSASGWIKKLLKEVSVDETFLNNTLESFYQELKQCGFIYGSNVDVVSNAIPKKDLTDEELCKVNLILAFFYFYKRNPSEEKFIDTVINFYSAITVSKTSVFQSLLIKKKSAALLEDLIEKRVHIDDNVFTKNFNYFITNALLFVDVLAYQKYLDTNTVSDKYLQDIETSIETIVIEVFESKLQKSKYDDSLTKLFKLSRRYHSNGPLDYGEAIATLKTSLEKRYIIDIACMASWTDNVIDKSENLFLAQFCEHLDLELAVLTQSIVDIDLFYSSNKSKIAALGSKNFVQSFYDNSSKMVMKLISRNSKRLLQELKESKELMVLLTKSTTRELTAAEHKKVQEQLMDIFKSIPSLAIFMLPGGALLLPLFIKFIPKLLPSAFDENRIDE
ncbi:LETM1-related biofilm-associated protein [uncultured Gelidibacter sp.]|uniref:LETM1-related biofilm-associated protein n=1 Tax=uncultured Gelidibacter sp. TaxID=259318 RepID=UPI00261A7EFE|nr:LETM1-related biofilm-associated protein [uncultured Gelidibacter sp.]